MVSAVISLFIYTAQCKSSANNMQGWSKGGKRREWNSILWGKSSLFILLRLCLKQEETLEKSKHFLNRHGSIKRRSWTDHRSCVQFKMLLRQKQKLRFCAGASKQTGSQHLHSHLRTFSVWETAAPASGSVALCVSYRRPAAYGTELQPTQTRSTQRVKQKLTSGSSQKHQAEVCRWRRCNLFLV